MEANQKGFGVVGILIVVIAVGLLGTIGWLVYDRQKNEAPETQASAQQKEEANQELINTGWKVYKSEKLKLSFEYPEGWTVKEENMISSGSRIYISSHSGEYNKANIPSGYQNIWLSNWDQEVSAEDENSVRNGSPRCCESAGTVTPGSIQAGVIDINTYEYQTVGGPKLDAYWTNNSQRYFATNASEIGNQDSMVDTLKKLLPTVKHL